MAHHPQLILLVALVACAGEAILRAKAVSLGYRSHVQRLAAAGTSHIRNCLALLTVHPPSQSLPLPPPSASR
jgi:hypothetical protein